MENIAGIILLVIMVAVVCFILGVLYRTYKLSKDYREVLREIIVNSQRSKKDIPESCFNDILVNFIKDKSITPNEFITLVRLNEDNEEIITLLQQLLNNRNNIIENNEKNDKYTEDKHTK